MKRAAIAFLTIYMILGMCAAADSAVAKVILQPESQVQPARSVKIGDIARIEAPQKLAKRIGEIVVATGPLPGKSKSIDAKYIKLRLKSANLKSEVDLVGPDTVDIVGKCVRISSEDLAEQAKAYVMERLCTDDITYDVIVERAPRQIVIAQAENVEVRPRLMSSSLRPGANTVVLEIMSNGKTAATTSVALTVKAVAEVLIATKLISQGEALMPSNTSWEKRDITTVRDAVIRDGDHESKEWIARRTIQLGCVITSQSIELPPDVKRGDTVNLTVKCGNVMLHTTAQVKEDGRKGDTIRVMSAVSQGEVRAQVVEPGLVEIVR
ncbi:flagellar basal body P-ring formation chaperone FlgA [bacterium]|nr:flagellar basal body P-ring formation chaperone FlgA [bacterium]